MQPQSESWTIGRLLSWTTSFLKERGSESPRLDAEVLLAHALNCERILLYTRFEETAKEEVRERFRELVRRRGEGAPVAYLVGHKEFFSLQFVVNPTVLIPRPDSEFVVMEFLRIAKPLAEVRGIDLGTGSGNLAIAAAHQHKGARFWAVDRSREAIQVAVQNAERHGVLDRIEFLEGDLFAPLPRGLAVDCIVSNPPYIPSGELAQLPVGVRDYEPHIALDGGPEGTDVVARIVGGALEYLKPSGQLILEIGSPQEVAVRKLIEDRAEYELLPTIFDFAGHARVISARRR